MKLPKQGTKFVDLGNKTIRKFTPNEDMEVNHMVISGRHPEHRDHYIYETGVAFMVYILKGTGIIYENDDKYEANTGDVFYIPTNTRFAAEGQDFEYLTFEHPAWFPEQASIVDSKNKLIEDTKT